MRHYERVARAIQQLEADILPQMYAAAEHAPATRDPNAPTAVMLVNGFSGLGLATLMIDPAAVRTTISQRNLCQRR